MASFIGKIIRKISVRLIDFYQKNISPHKGYCCAYRVLHGEDSCSEYVKNVFLHQNLQDCIKLSRERFNQCAKAEIELKQQGKIIHTQGISSKVNLSRRQSITLLIPLFLLGLSAPAMAGGGSLAAKGCMEMSENSGSNSNSNNSNDDGSSEAFCCGSLAVTFGLLSAIDEQSRK